MQTTRQTWDFLRNTYWYVTAPDLQALQFSASDNQLSALIDQTVWHLTGSQGGYIWGASASAMGIHGKGNSSSPPEVRQNRIVGTVSVAGHVLMDFVSGSGLQESIITAFGSMVMVDEQWVFQMQMSTGAQGKQTLHWANMTQTRPGDESFVKLPGVPYSVPEILEGASYPRFSEATENQRG